MRNTNKSVNFPIPQCSAKMEKDRESVFGTGALQKVNKFFQLAGPVTTPHFNEIGSLPFH